MLLDINLWVISVFRPCISEFHLHRSSRRDWLILKGGTDRLSRNVGELTTNLHWVTSQKSEDLSINLVRVMSRQRKETWTQACLIKWTSSTVLTTLKGNRDRPAGMVTKLGAGQPKNRGSIPNIARDFSFLQRVQNIQPPTQCVPGIFCQGESDRGIKMTIHLQLLIRIYGAKSPIQTCGHGFCAQ
jgi:hypothetical protein